MDERKTPKRAIRAVVDVNGIPVVTESDAVGQRKPGLQEEPVGASSSGIASEMVNLALPIDSVNSPIAGRGINKTAVIGDLIDASVDVGDQCQLVCPRSFVDASGLPIAHIEILLLIQGESNDVLETLTDDVIRLRSVGQDFYDGPAISTEIGPEFGNKQFVRAIDHD